MWATAAELWSEWERSRVLRPQDYDSDVAEHVWSRLSAAGGRSSSSIRQGLEEANWSPRDLIHALAPLVSSFAGMQRDLLRLMERVGASSGTGENLRVVYEFAPGDLIDESLADFRERVRTIERVGARLRPWLFDEAVAWNFPLWDHQSWEWIELTVAGARVEQAADWRFDSHVADPAPTGDPRVDERARQVLSFVRYALARLQALGDDTNEMRERLYASSPVDEIDPELRAIAQAATDYWPLSVASAVHGWVRAVAEGEVAVSQQTLDELDDWLERLESGEAREVTIEQVVDELTDVLSLPEWGKRHELYSAWIATQLDRALDSRLDFVVTDGALRFPFRPTLLARLDPPSGDLALWCEVRSPGVGQLGGGRKASIQPDYRFQRISDGATVTAVEVKQYKASAGRRHSVTMRDYVASLPGATVFLVAHGPLGHGILEAVPATDRDRALVHENVRADRPRESASFRRAIATLFPPPPPPPPKPADITVPPAPAARPTRIELRWSRRVRDLDLHVRDAESETAWDTLVTRHSALREDQFDGGPEIVDLAPKVDQALKVRVHVYSTATLREAAPVVRFLRDDDVLIELVPAEALLGSSERWWTVAHIDALGHVTPSLYSREAPSNEGRS